MCFVLGSCNNSLKSKLIEEQQRHGDLLQLDLPEGWSNIVLKTIGFFDWAASGNKKWQFIAKADVDSIWNLTSIFIGLRSLGDLEELSNIPSGFGFPVSNVDAWWIKHKIPKSFCCSNHTYPNYLDGGTPIK